MKKIKELWNRIFNQWTPWVLEVKDFRYLKTISIFPISGIENPIEQQYVTVDIYTKTNRYTGKKKRKYVEKKA
jgi:hypothetical protein